MEAELGGVVTSEILVNQHNASVNLLVGEGWWVVVVFVWVFGGGVVGVLCDVRACVECWSGSEA